MTNREIQALITAITPGLESVAIALGCGNPEKVLFIMGVKKALSDGLTAAREAGQS